MTDKELFLNEIEAVKLIIQANRAQGAFSEGYLIGQESVLEHFEKFVRFMQEEPVHRTKADVEAAMAEIEEKSRAFTEAHKGETAEEILAQMRGEEPVSKVWHDSGETPKDIKADIIIEGDVFNTKLFYACCTFESPFLKWEFVKRWAYIDNLLKL